MGKNIAILSFCSLALTGCGYTTGRVILPVKNKEIQREVTTTELTGNAITTNVIGYTISDDYTFTGSDYSCIVQGSMLLMPSLTSINSDNTIAYSNSLNFNFALNLIISKNGQKYNYSNIGVLPFYQSDLRIQFGTAKSNLQTQINFDYTNGFMLTDSSTSGFRLTAYGSELNIEAKTIAMKSVNNDYYIVDAPTLDYDLSSFKTQFPYLTITGQSISEWAPCLSADEGNELIPYLETNLIGIVEGNSYTKKVSSNFYSYIYGSEYTNGYNEGYTVGQENPTVITWLKGTMSVLDSALSIPVLGSITLANILASFLSLLLLVWVLRWFV
jgi:hypothetical protein